MLRMCKKCLNMLRSALQDDRNKNCWGKNPKIARKVDYKVGDKVFVNSLNQFANVLKSMVEKRQFKFKQVS